MYRNEVLHRIQKTKKMNIKSLKFSSLAKGAVFLFLTFAHMHLAGQSFEHLQKTPSSSIPEGFIPVVSTENHNITLVNGVFVDATGRSMFLRGINLGGSTKVPFTPNIASHVNEGFFNGTELSFVGRPFPLKDADIHFQRLKAWGFHFLRFLVTWEAIEHEGPGIYDTAYLEYIKAIIIKADEYGINVLIDPHQDVWSRYTGGDGAPLWTFEVAGMDATKFQEAGAAFVHNVYGDPFPQMIWYTNYFKLGAGTMFTLFFAGNDFAPKTQVNGVPIQEYLQEHYIDAMAQIAQTLKDLPNVIGFELMNEPSAGFIGIDNIEQPFHTDIIGDSPTAYQGMLLGAGIPQSVQKYRLGAVALKKNGEPILNTQKVSVWQDNQPGIWQQHGVWGKSKEGAPQLLNASYFSMVNGKHVDFNTMYYEPFAKKYAQAILAINPDWIICVDNVLFPYPHSLPELKKYKDIKWINGSHWYDDVTLIKKKYLPILGLKGDEVVFGRKNVRKAFESTLAEMIEETYQQYGNVPSLLGEFGIPFDMNKAKAYKTNNFSKQVKALDRSFRVVESNLLNYTLWNYTADNTNQYGDLWNNEDLSVFSVSQRNSSSDINSGGRALEAVIRPFPKKITGKLTEFNYDYKSKKLQLGFNVDEVGTLPTEIFIPEFVYGNNFIVYSDAGKLTFNKEERILMYYPEKTGSHQIVITPK